MIDGTTLRPATGQPLDHGYPLAFSVADPERLSRVSTAFRLILVIPILVIVAALLGAAALFGDGGLTATFAVEPYFRVHVPNFMTTAGVLMLAPLLDDPLSPEISALVVRLEPPAAAVAQPGQRLRAAVTRRVPVDR